MPDLETPPELKRQHAALYRARVRFHEDGGWCFHRARRWRRGGIDVLHLEGDRFEMAFQHGRLLRAEIADGGLEQVGRVTANAVANNLGSGLTARVVAGLAARLITRPMLRHALAQAEPGVTPEYYLADAYGLSEGAGVPVETIVAAGLAPETAQVLLGLTASRHAGLCAAVASGQCSSLTAWGEATAGGELLIGRNTDYPLNGFFDRYPTLIYYRPTDGSRRFASVTSAGLHNGGVAGINDAGVYLAVHTVPTNHVDRRGTPVFMLAQEVLRRASCFDEAVALFQARPPAAGWSYHLVSCRERRVATVELASDGMAIFEAEGDAHVTTNHWRTPTMRRRYLHVNASIDEDSVARMERLQRLIADAAGGLDLRGALAALADKTDPLHARDRTLPNTVAVHTTVSSSVWLPDRGQLLMANGAAPVAHNTYVAFPLPERFDPRTFADTACEMVDNGGWPRANPRRAAAERAFIAAKKAFEYDNNARAALQHLRRAVALEPDEPSLHLVRGLFAARVGEMFEALEALDAALGAGFDGRRQAVAHYARGRVLAHVADRRAAALPDLQLAASHPRAGVKLRRAARRALRRVRRRARVPLAPTEMAIYMQQADVLDFRRPLPWSGRV